MERNPVEIFDDTELLVEELHRIADNFDAAREFGEAYWLRESAVSLLGMYEDIIELYGKVQAAGKPSP